ncbi:MAG: 3'-5' exonuclease [Candidatus Sericytochromatia bacterium]|nr:3'-5' exonuclease [Candidatus Sericytochromatia bacterium]
MTAEWLLDARRVVVLDLETTGLDPHGDSILEIAAIRLEEGEEVGRLETLVNPGAGVVIPEASRAIHGIDADMVAEAPAVAEALATLRSFVADAPIVAHHALFDLAFLNRAAALTGQPRFDGPVIDTLEVAREVFPEQRSHKLEALCQLLGRPAEGFHRAGLDASHLAAIYPLLRDRWLAHRAWQEAQFRCIDEVAQRYDHVTRLQESLQLEANRLKRTLTLFLERQPEGLLPLPDGALLALQARERYEYDQAAVSTLLAAWGLEDQLLKPDRQRLERWLHQGRFSEGQRQALEAARVPLAPQARLVRLPRAQGAEAQEGTVQRSDA